MRPAVVPAGARALLLELASPDDVPGWCAALPRALAEAGLPAPEELVPGARTILLDGVDPAAVRAVLERVVAQPPAPPGETPLVEVPVVYDGADLDAVAELWGVPADEVVARHAAARFRVAFCGFAPGFAYLTGLDAAVPRRATPRHRVPAGSVALAGRYCGIYPSDSPGGWQLVGRTSARLFDPERASPALLPPGTRVRFVPVAALDAEPQPRPAPPAPAARALTVVQASGLCTVQDRGRPGYAHLGVPRSGAADPAAADLGNRLVGNAPDAAVVETTLGGLTVRASAAMTVAVTGARGPVRLAGRPVDGGAPHVLPAGQELTIGVPELGVRSYLAVAGGIGVDPVIGSRSRDVLSGLGPAALAAGDVLPVGAPQGSPAPVHFTIAPAAPSRLLLRLHPGPRADWFGEPGLRALLDTAWEVSPSSNRVGVRLAGPGVPRLRADELESEGLVLGAVQVPPDGQPVIMLADHPTTGGYPVIGVVDAADLPALAQARPGTRVRFAKEGRS